MADDPRPTTPDEDPLVWENANRRRAGLSAAAAGALTLIGSIVTILANSGAPDSDTGILTLVDTLGRTAAGQPVPPGHNALVFAYQGRHAAVLILGTLLVGAGTLAMFPPLAFLFRAAKARPTTRGSVPRFALIAAAVGTVASGIGLTVSGIALWLLAADFVNASDQTNSVAVAARSDPIVLAGALIGEIGSLALAVAFLMICLYAQRSGLLGRFMGVVGMFAGATIVFRQFDPPGVVRSLWMGALALLILDNVPRLLRTVRRPPAWAVAEAVPWPSQQQIREEREAARRKAAGEPEPEPGRPARARGRGRASTAEDGGREAPDRPRTAPVPAPQAPRPRREDTAPGRAHPSSKKRKRKRRS
jgi:hypothetical protein